MRHSSFWDASKHTQSSFPLSREGWGGAVHETRRSKGASENPTGPTASVLAVRHLRRGDGRPRVCARPLEVVRTLTVKHPSIRWMFSVLFISKSDCILINCGINKVLKGRKIKMTVTHKNKKNADGLTFAMCSFQGCVCFSFCYYGWHRPASCPSFLPRFFPSLLPSFTLTQLPPPPPSLPPPACESKWDAIKEKSTDTNLNLTARHLSLFRFCPLAQMFGAFYSLSAWTPTFCVRHAESQWNDASCFWRYWWRRYQLVKYQCFKSASPTGNLKSTAPVFKGPVCKI